MSKKSGLHAWLFTLLCVIIAHINQRKMAWGEASHKTVLDSSTKTL
jgi:hypothetical protein